MRKILNIIWTIQKDKVSSEAVQTRTERNRDDPSWSFVKINSGNPSPPSKRISVFSPRVRTQMLNGSNMMW